MGKYVRFYDMTVAIPMKEDESWEDIEDRLIEAVESAGSGFASYKIEICEEEDEEEPTLEDWE